MHVVGFLIYLVVGVVQVIAILQGISAAFGIPKVLAFMAALFLGYVPLVGAGFGMWGAHTVWGWSWLGAAALFFGAQVGVLILAMSAAVLEARTTR